jgi:hypothetical protein
MLDKKELPACPVKITLTLISDNMIKVRHGKTKSLETDPCTVPGFEEKKVIARSPGAGKTYTMI